jgi:hypothetical protein
MSSSHGRPVASSKRFQRMAYGMSNKEVAQSAADAPNASFGLEESWSKQPGYRSRRDRALGKASFLLGSTA